MFDLTSNGIGIYLYDAFEVGDIDGVTRGMYRRAAATTTASTANQSKQSCCGNDFIYLCARK